MSNNMAGRNNAPGTRTGRWLIAVAAAAAALTAAYGYNMTMHDRARGGGGGVVATSDVAALDRATTQNPDNLELWKQLAQAQRRAGNTTAAITALVRAARIDPHDAEISSALRDLSRTRR